MVMIAGSLPQCSEESILRKSMAGPTFRMISSMWSIQSNFESKVIPRYLVLSTKGMGILLHAKVAFMLMYGRRENTMVEDLEAETASVSFLAL